MNEFEFDVPLIDSRPATFIDKVKLGDDVLVNNDAKPCELFLFGGKIKVNDLPAYPDAFRLAFAIVEKTPEGNFVSHEMEQHNSVMYKTKENVDDYESVDMLKPSQMPFLFRKPKWKAYDASWPYYETMPFYFVKQFFIGKQFKETISWDFSIYLFVYFTAGKTYLRIFTQDMNEQTAEDHYLLEEMMAEFDANTGNMQKIEALIRKGDKFFHEYVMGHKRCNAAMLALVVQYAKTKKLKDAATKQLKSKVE
ncbi:hypothetical protein ACI6Q2_12650 [Chitinophagaceae bacterium LWZ2-11]